MEPHEYVNPEAKKQHKIVALARGTLIVSGTFLRARDKTTRPAPSKDPNAATLSGGLCLELPAKQHEVRCFSALGQDDQHVRQT